jgi:hypothetical protein
MLSGWFSLQIKGQGALCGAGHDADELDAAATHLANK